MEGDKDSIHGQYNATALSRRWSGHDWRYPTPTHHSGFILTCVDDWVDEVDSMRVSDG